MTSLVYPIASRPVVAHVVHSLGIGGLENGVVNLVNTAGPRFRHVIVCMTTDGVLRNRLKPAVEIFTLGKRRGHDLRAFVRLVRVLRQTRPAIVHSRNWAAFDAVLAARLARVPLVVHGEHGREVTDPDGQNRRRNWARRALAPLVNRFVTVSQDLRRWLIEDVRLPAHKVTTIQNGVDLTRFGHHGRHEARLRLGLPAEALVLGTVGRLDPVKDHATLIQAFAGLAPAHPDAALLIVGDGPCRSDLDRLVTGIGLENRVRLFGSRADVPVVLATMDVFVLPSVAEGMSNTILEAMATGLPVVATRVGGNPELIEDGVGGALVPRHDQAALTEALSAYLDDGNLRSVHGKASRQRAVDHFGLERMCAAYVDLYSGLLAGSTARTR